MPPPYGEQFSKETLIKSASSKAFAATTEASTKSYQAAFTNVTQDLQIADDSTAGPNSDPLRDGFQACGLDSDEVVKLLDACIRHDDHFNGFKVAAMILLGISMGFRGKGLS